MRAQSAISTRTNKTRGFVTTRDSIQVLLDFARTAKDNRGAAKTLDCALGRETVLYELPMKGL
jgi:hypothetical protein